MNILPTYEYSQQWPRGYVRATTTKAPGNWGRNSVAVTTSGVPDIRIRQSVQCSRKEKHPCGLADARIDTY